ncbi:MAG TPA: hypothetical protein VHW26_11560 [Solirubrobacteraceae bacterium]|nr:hypothetical protein [Solirubrobacteraceae bacterium]
MNDLPDESSPTHEDRLASELVAAGGDFAAASVGGALGLIGGPVGVVVGAAGGVAATRVFRRVGAQLRRRWLDPRQELRLAGAYTIAADQVKSRLAAGAQPRGDGFFESGVDDRAPAEELLEGVLRAAADAYEEKKVPFLANMYCSLVFRPDISPAYANSLIQLAAACTWRQLVILAFLGNGPADLDADGNLILDSRPMAAAREPRSAVWLAFDGLGSLGLIGVRQNDDSVARVGAIVGTIGSFENFGAEKAELTSIGRDLFDLMQLRCLQRHDLAELNAVLRQP